MKVQKQIEDYRKKLEDYRKKLQLYNERPVIKLIVNQEKTYKKIMTKDAANNQIIVLFIALAILFTLAYLLLV